MNKYSSFFKYWIFLLYQITIVKSQFNYEEDKKTKAGFYFNFDKCPPNNVNTASKPVIQIKILKDFWPSYSTFQVNRADISIFVYNPSDDTTLKDDKRIIIHRKTRSKDFMMYLSYEEEIDAGIDFEYGFVYKPYANWFPFCTAFISDDMTPKAILSKRSPPETGIRDKTNYVEGEKVLVTCRILKRFNQTFAVHFPDNTKFIEEDSKSRDRKIYTVTLTRNIRGLPITCWVDGGYNTTRTDILKFDNKPHVIPPVDRTNVAISIAVVFALLLVVMLPFGAYTLIIKQRKDQTKVMIEHHKEEVQTRIEKQVTQMSRMSRMSRMQDVPPETPV